MEKIRNNWCAMYTYEKIVFVLGGICSISVIILACLQLLGIWEKAINVLEPLVGVSMVTQTILQWKKNKKVAAFSLCVAIFIFIVGFLILFNR